MAYFRIRSSSVRSASAFNQCKGLFCCWNVYPYPQNQFLKLICCLTRFIIILTGLTTTLLIWKGITMKELNELLQRAEKETDYINEGEIFLLKDLFKGYEWNRISHKNRLLLGTLFLFSVNRKGGSIVAFEKTSSKQQKYKKTIKSEV